jgi:cytochrome P450
MYAISNLPAAWASIRGRYVTVMSQLHEKYGDTVRIGPNNLSFSSSTAFKDILAIKPGRPQLTKDPVMYNVPINGVHSILTTPSDADHARYRRLLAHGFSEKAMREQEPLIKGYVDLLIQRLREHAKDGPQDMVAWYNWTTFDLIGDLTFNEPFSCLENATYHPWIEFVFGGVKAAQLLSQARKFPLFRSILMFLFRKKLIAARLKGAEFTKAKVDHRIRAETDRLDFLGYVLRHEGKDVGMSRKEIDSTSTILVLGGSETTATLLSGVTYYLLSNPRTMERLVKEIREKFNSEDEITISSVNTLPYQLAVLEEAMRIFPPAPIGSPRVVGENGQAIDGQLVPGGVYTQPNFTHRMRC